MIKLKPLLKEHPDRVYMLRYKEMDQKRLSWSDWNAYPFYIYKGKAYVGEGGDMHVNYIQNNLKLIYSLFKNEPDIAAYKKNNDPDDLRYSINHTTEYELTRLGEDLIGDLSDVFGDKSDMFGRYWIFKGTIEGVKNPYVVAFWSYPDNNAELMKCLRLLKIPVNRAFIDIDPNLEENWDYLMPAAEYKTPTVKYVPPVPHELPPHLR